MFPNKVPDTWIFQNGFWLSIFLDIHRSWSFYWNIVDIWLSNMKISGWRIWVTLSWKMGKVVSRIAPYGVWKVVRSHEDGTSA